MELSGTDQKNDDSVTTTTEQASVSGLTERKNVAKKNGQAVKEKVHHGQFTRGKTSERVCHIERTTGIFRTQQTGTRDRQAKHVVGDPRC